MPSEKGGHEYRWQLLVPSSTSRMYYSSLGVSHLEFIICAFDSLCHRPLILRAE